MIQQESAVFDLERDRDVPTPFHLINMAKYLQAMYDISNHVYVNEAPSKHITCV